MGKRFGSSAPSLFLAHIFFTVLLFVPLCLRAQAPEPPAASQSQPLSAGAERIYAQTRSKLLQVRTLTKTARSQSSIGSAFLVATDLAITNYHVVSQKVMQADRYELEWLSTDNIQGPLTVVAVDVARDLALVKVGAPLSPNPSAATQTVAQVFGPPLPLASKEPSRGERVYSLGRPLDLGFNIIEGTHNGLVEGDFNQRYLFSGAINAGMSGGPAVNARGEVFGVNVAKNLRGELVSYLVPIEFARELMQQLAAGKSAPEKGDNFFPQMTEQIKGHQSRLAQALFSKPLLTRPLGPYRIPAEQAPLLKCWADTTRSDSKLKYLQDSLQCRVDASIYIDGRFLTGTVGMRHLMLSSDQLNRIQFQTLVSERHSPAKLGLIRQHLTPDRCKDEFVENNGTRFRATFCAQALKKFPGLYDFGLSLTSLDANETDAKGMRRTLMTIVHMDGMTWETGMLIAERFLQAVGRQ